MEQGAQILGRSVFGGRVWGSGLRADGAVIDGFEGQGLVFSFGSSRIEGVCF